MGSESDVSAVVDAKCKLNKLANICDQFCATRAAAVHPPTKLVKEQLGVLRHGGIELEAVRHCLPARPDRGGGRIGVNDSASIWAWVRSYFA